MIKNIISTVFCVAIMLIGANGLSAQNAEAIQANAQRLVKKLDARFDLSDKQEAEIFTIYSENFMALAELKENTKLSAEEKNQKSSEIKGNLDTSFRAVLTKKQLELLGPKRKKSGK